MEKRAARILSYLNKNKGTNLGIINRITENIYVCSPDDIKDYESVQDLSIEIVVKLDKMGIASRVKNKLKKRGIRCESLDITRKDVYSDEMVKFIDNYIGKGKKMLFCANSEELTTEMLMIYFVKKINQVMMNKMTRDNIVPRTDDIPFKVIKYMKCARSLMNLTPDAIMSLIELDNQLHKYMMNSMSQYSESSSEDSDESEGTKSLQELNGTLAGIMSMESLD